MCAHRLVVDPGDAAVQVCGGAQLDGHVVGEAFVQEVWRRLGPAAHLALALFQTRCGRKKGTRQGQEARKRAKDFVRGTRDF